MLTVYRYQIAPVAFLRIHYKITATDERFLIYIEDRKSVV